MHSLLREAGTRKSALAALASLAGWSLQSEEPDP
jgi:hypothetical protein